MAIKYIQLPVCKLAEFVSSSATSFDVSGFLYNDGVTAVDPADIGDICYATLEPRTIREELISFTIDSVTSAGVATITAVRGLSQKSPYSTGGASFDHQNGSDFVISNNPGLFNQLTAKDNTETVTAQWTFPTPTIAGAPVTKSYAEAQFVYLTGAQSVAGVKTFTSSPVIPDATADDEPLAKGQFDAATVKLTGDQTVAGVKTFSSSPIVPTATTATEAMNKSQVETYIAANSGDIKASDSAFGTTKLDVAADDPADPKAVTATADRVAALSGGGSFGTPDASNKFVTEDFLSTQSVTQQTFNSSGSYTPTTGATYFRIQAWGGGGSGGRDASTPETGGGGGGGYSERWMSLSEISAPVTVTIGAGGAARSTNSNGAVGGTTTFGTYLTAYGGGGGSVNSSGSGGGGGGGALDAGSTASGATGGAGGDLLAGDGGSEAVGENSYQGAGGGGASDSGAGHNGGNSVWGGGGGGGVGTNAGAGGTSSLGGDGGVGGSSANGTAGSQPAGGGGASVGGTSGAGGDGRVVVTEFYS